MTSPEKDKALKSKLIIIDREKLSLSIPDENTLKRLIVDLEAKPEYFLVEF